MADAKTLPEFRNFIPWKLAVVFIFFTVTIIIAGSFYYNSQKKRIFKEQESNLSAIATLKISQIAQWHNERLGNAAFIDNNEPLINTIKEYLNNESSAELKNEITKWMEAVCIEYEYNGVTILDTHKKIRIAFAPSDSIITEAIPDEIDDVIINKRIVMTDLRMGKEKPYIELLIPLKYRSNNINTVFGVLILQIDPSKSLFSIVQSWPVTSKTAETLLLRKEGDSVLYLNELRFQKNTALKLSRPISQKDLLASKAISGYSGVVEGVDYRRMPVIGYVTAIPGLPWYMVAKVDEDEIRIPLKRLFNITGTVIILMLLISAFLFGFLTWQKLINGYRKQLENERALRESDERFTTAFRLSPVSIAISSLISNKFIDVNQTFLTDMEYNRAEVIGRTAKELDIWNDENERLWLINELSQKNNIFGKIISFKSKSGKIIYGLCSMSVVNVDGQTCNLSTVVNITESIKTEEKFRKSEELFRKLFENMLNGFAYCRIICEEGSPPDFLYLKVNEAFVKLTGLKDVEGKKASVAIPGIQEADPELLEKYKRVALTGKPEVFETYVESLEMWFAISVYSPQKEYFVAVFDVITARKLSEESLKISEKRYRNIFNSLIEGFCIVEMVFDENNTPVDYRFLEINSAFEKQTGLNDAKGKLMRDLVPSNEQYWFDIYGNVALTGESVRFENEAKALNRWFEVRASRVDDNKSQHVAIYFNDITERKLSEAALRESEDKFKYIFDHSVIGKSITFPSGEMQVNKAFCNMLGYTPEELSRKKWQDISHADEIEKIQIETDLLLSGERDSSRFLKRYIHKNGDVLWADVSTVLRRDRENTPLYFMTSINDITERKNAEDALRESEEKFKYIFDNSVMGNSISLPAGEAHFNKAFCEIVGYSAEELEKLKWQDFTHPDDFEITQKVFDKIKSGESNSERFIKRYIHKDGSIIWADVSTSFASDNTGKPIYFMTTINDITDLKLAEEILRNDEKRFRELIEALPQLYWTCKDDGPCDYLSKQWVEYTGIKESDQLGYGWLQQLHPEDRDRTVSEWMEKVKIKDNFDIEFRIRKYDGEYHWFKTRAVPIRNGENKIVRWLGANTDIDSIRKAEAQLINYNKDLEKSVALRTEQLEAANKELEAFTYSVSHDLRAPLRSLNGFTKILQEDYETILDKEGNRICGIISSSATQMGELIDDLLSFSRIGRSSVTSSDIDMKKMAQVIFEGITSPAERERIKLKFGKMHTAVGDVTLFGHVWTNLLSNAIKYSSKKDDSKINIGSYADDKMIVFFIKDNGVGFDMKYSHKLFGVFQRLHTEAEFEGNGVGLAIIQRIIAKHGGKVWAEGELGKGATFYFSLPVQEEHETQPRYNFDQ